MIIENIKAIVSSYDGKPVKIQGMPGGDTGTTLKDFLIAAVNANKEGEKLSSAESYQRYQLGLDIYNAKSQVDLESEDVALIKEGIHIMFGHVPMVYGKLIDMIEPPKKVKEK